MNAMIKIGIAGSTGRVGRLLVQELLSGDWEDLSFSGGLARNPESQQLADLYLTDDIAALFENSDVVIDFTRPEATISYAKMAAEKKKTLVIGTTGLSERDEQVLAKAAEEASIVYSANMSVGVTLLTELVRKAAATLDPSWDIEIFEAHHREKEDAPSGTALALGHAASQGRSRHPEASTHDALYNQTSREGSAFAFDRKGKRVSGEIGFAVSRGGDVVGDHAVTFYGMGERLELSHRATNRALFARGALKAAIWAHGKPPGLYSMRDVLGLNTAV